MINMENTNTIYKVTGAGIDYIKGFVREVKKLNPNINISAKWIEKKDPNFINSESLIDRNYKQEQLTIICSTPL